MPLTILYWNSLPVSEIYCVCTNKLYLELWVKHSENHGMKTWNSVFYDSSAFSQVSSVTLKKKVVFFFFKWIKLRGPDHAKEEDIQPFLLLYSCSLTSFPSFFPLSLHWELKYQWTFLSIFSDPARILLVERKSVNQKIKSNLLNIFSKP